MVKVRLKLFRLFMFGKTLKELNTKISIKKIKRKNFSYENIASESEFSYFRLNLKSNCTYLLNENSFYFFLNKGNILINNKNIYDQDKNLIFSKTINLSYINIVCF